MGGGGVVVEGPRRATAVAVAHVVERLRQRRRSSAAAAAGAPALQQEEQQVSSRHECAGVVRCSTLLSLGDCAKRNGPGQHLPGRRPAAAGAAGKQQAGSRVCRLERAATRCPAVPQGMHSCKAIRSGCTSDRRPANTLCSTHTAGRRWCPLVLCVSVLMHTAGRRWCSLPAYACTDTRFVSLCAASQCTLQDGGAAGEPPGSSPRNSSSSGSSSCALNAVAAVSSVTAAEVAGHGRAPSPDSGALSPVASGPTASRTSASTIPTAATSSTLTDTCSQAQPGVPAHRGDSAGTDLAATREADGKAATVAAVVRTGSGRRAAGSNGGAAAASAAAARLADALSRVSLADEPVEGAVAMRLFCGHCGKEQVREHTEHNHLGADVSF